MNQGSNIAYKIPLDISIIKIDTMEKNKKLLKFDGI